MPLPRDRWMRWKSDQQVERLESDREQHPVPRVLTNLAAFFVRQIM
ncbi:MAG: hypothetical protein OXC62_17135 [Aestuariivita sp.]|nr:hypothetical protein [Aestuariivita sp.]